MKILMKLLESVTGYNSFCEVSKLEYLQGSGSDIYFRLVQHKSAKCEECDQLRYIPEAGATLQLTFDSIDSNKQIVRSAVMAFPSDDRSVWKVSMMPGDMLSGVMKGTLTEGSKITPLLLDGRLLIISSGDSKFFC
jgi:hypothetical protein